MTQSEKIQRWNDFHRMQGKIERKYKLLVKRALLSQIDDYLKFAQENGFEQANSMISALVRPNRVEPVIKAIHKESGLRWGWITYRDLRSQKSLFGASFDETLKEFLQLFLAQYAAIAARHITETTQNWILEQVQKGLDAGEGYREISLRLRGDGINNYRALLITRTESVGASNAAGDAAASKTGLVLNDTWISAQDNRTRRIPRDQADHLNMNNVEVPHGTPFHVLSKNGFDLMMAPGDPNAPADQRCNCRCCKAYVPQRDSRGRLIRTVQTV